MNAARFGKFETVSLSQFQANETGFYANVNLSTHCLDKTLKQYNTIIENKAYITFIRWVDKKKKKLLILFLIVVLGENLAMSISQISRVHGTRVVCDSYVEKRHLIGGRHFDSVDDLIHEIH